MRSSTSDSGTPVVRNVRQTYADFTGRIWLKSGTTVSVNIGRNSRGGPGNMINQLSPLSVRKLFDLTFIAMPGAVPFGFARTVAPSGTNA